MQKVHAIIYAVFISEIKCESEAELRGRMKPRYGSVRFMVTHVQIGGTIYSIDRFSNIEHAGKLLNVDLVEERLIAEVSLVYDKDGVVDRHQHITGLNEGALYALPLTSEPFVRKGHKTQLIKKDEKLILTYFIKAWGDYVENIEEVTEGEKQYLDSEHSMYPAQLVTHFISNITLEDLVLV